MKYVYLLALIICMNSHAQVSRFYKDGQWWVSWDSKDAQVQVFRPMAGNLSIDTGAITFSINQYNTTAKTIAKYRADCKGKSFYHIKDSMFNAPGNSYLITFDNGIVVESGLVPINSASAPPWSNERKWFADHLMFHVMYACTDDNWLYCPCGAKFPLVKK